MSAGKKSEGHSQKKDLEERLKKLYEWSNDWGVDFNPTKTKHMVFNFGTKKKEINHETSVFV